MIPEQLDRQRATGAQLLTARVTTTDDSPLIVDLMPSPVQKCHWIIENLCLMASLASRAPSTPGGYPPLTGLFLCPPGTLPETLAQAQTDNWNMAARPILLPMGLPGGDFAELGVAPPYAMALSLAAGYKLTVPINWFVRAILTCAQGTATPGPGSGSIGVLSALATLETDKTCP